MNKGLFKVVTLGLMVALVGMVSCGGEAPEQKRQQSKLEKMRPKADDRRSILMDKAWDNLIYMMYGFLSYDKVKIDTATANLTAISPYIAQKISPQYYERSAEWKAQCNSQQETADNLRRHFEAQNFEEARKSLHGLIETCMECHKVYRQHLLTPEEEESP